MAGDSLDELQSRRRDVLASKTEATQKLIDALANPAESAECAKEIKMSDLRSNAFSDNHPALSESSAPPPMDPGRQAAMHAAPMGGQPSMPRAPTPPLGPNFFAPPPGYRTQREREREKEIRASQPAPPPQMAPVYPAPAPQQNRGGRGNAREANGMALSQMTLYVEPDWHVGTVGGPYLECPAISAAPLECVVAHILAHAQPGHVGRVGLTPDSASPRAYIHFTDRAYADAMLGILVPGATRVQCRVRMPTGQQADYRLLRAKPKNGQDYEPHDPSVLVFVRGPLPPAPRLIESLGSYSMSGSEGTFEFATVDQATQAVYHMPTERANWGLYVNFHDKLAHTSNRGAVVRHLQPGSTLGEGPIEAVTEQNPPPRLQPVIRRSASPDARRSGGGRAERSPTHSRPAPYDERDRDRDRRDRDRDRDRRDRDRDRDDRDRRRSRQDERSHSASLPPSYPPAQYPQQPAQPYYGQPYQQMPQYAMPQYAAPYGYAMPPQQYGYPQAYPGYGPPAGSPQPYGQYPGYPPQPMPGQPYGSPGQPQHYQQPPPGQNGGYGGPPPNAREWGQQPNGGYEPPPQGIDPAAMDRKPDMGPSSQQPDWKDEDADRGFLGGRP